MRYPFEPKSTRYLEPGQFWAIPITGGRFACGRVLQTGGEMLPVPSRHFFGGLMDWVGPTEPTADAIAGRRLLAVGAMHVRAITKLGGRVLGCRALELDSFEMPILLSEMGGSGAMTLRGAVPMRAAERAERAEWGTRPVLGYWGWDYIQTLAERAFG